MGSNFGANLSIKHAVVFIHPKLEMIFTNADDCWIKLEHTEMIPRTIQTLFDTLTKLVCCLFKANYRVMKVVLHEKILV